MEEHKQLLERNIVPAIRDFTLGDRSLEGLITNAEIETLSKGLHIITHDMKQSPAQRMSVMANSWTIFDRVRSPTPEEFLTPEWIGPMGTDIFPHMRKIFTEYWDPTSKYNSLILGMAIGTGKTTLSVLSNLYISVNLWCKRNPKRYFNAAPTTAFVQALISFSQDKAAQLMLQPFIQLLKSSPRFHRVKQEEHLDRHQREHPNEICWTTSSRIGQLQFWGDIHYPIAASPHNLLGLNMISATMSEISFFIERGFSPDYIWRIFQDSKARVKNRFGTNRLATIILDSSPNDLEFSPIDRYIFTGEAQKDKTNYIVTGPHWQFRSDHDQYKDWRATGKTFTVFRGNGSAPPALLKDEATKKKYDAMDLVEVPIDLETIFIENLNKNVKDYIGWPAGNPDKLIREASFIDRMFKPNLRNFYSYIHVPANVEPKHQLWNVVRDQFFVEVAPGKWEFYRAPRAERFMHFDQAETKDHAGICMSHMEWDPVTKETVCVHDFTIDIAPSLNRISLDAIRLFPEDLRSLGRINLKIISFDQTQSSLTKQYLERKEFDVRPLSVDRDIKIYQAYIAQINAGRIKAGRNIGLKGNLRSLQEVRSEKSGHRKVEHTIGKVVKDDGGNWVSSLMGVNAKDVSDACAGSFWHCMVNNNINSASALKYIWEEPESPKLVFDEDFKVVGQEKPQTKEKSLSEAKERYLALIAKKHGYIVKDP